MCTRNGTTPRLARRSRAFERKDSQTHIGHSSMRKGQPPGGQFVLTKSMTVFDGKAGSTLYANEAVNFQTIRSSHMRSRKFFRRTDTEQNAP
jgi:hypothetical protein